MKSGVVPELLKEGITIYREVVVEPWRIVYKIEHDTVYIMVIFDSRQNIEELLLQKLLLPHQTTHRDDVNKRKP